MTFNLEHISRLKVRRTQPLTRQTLFALKMWHRKKKTRQISSRSPSFAAFSQHSAALSVCYFLPPCELRSESCSYSDTHTRALCMLIVRARSMWMTYFSGSAPPTATAAHVKLAKWSPPPTENVCFGREERRGWGLDCFCLLIVMIFSGWFLCHIILLGAVKGVAQFVK